jgi:predicted dinucleotide-binding enzyme
MEPTRAGVLGSGVVGRVLAAGLRSRGHDVTLGTRVPGDADDELRAWSQEHGVPLATFADTAAGAQLIVLATKGVANEEAIALAGPGNFAGKVVIDATNPLDFSGGGPALAVGHTDSGGEIVQRALPDARVVKAFNTVGNTLFVDPQLPGGRHTMFIAGDDADANATVVALLEDFGWDALVVGGIESSRELEALCILWVKAAQALGGKYDHAITLVAP